MQPMGAPEKPSLTQPSAAAWPCLAVTVTMITTVQGPTMAVLEAAKEEKGKKTKCRAPDGGVGSFWVVYRIDPQGDRTVRSGTQLGVAWQRRQPKSVSALCPLLGCHLSAHPRPTLLYPYQEFHGDELCAEQSPQSLCLHLDSRSAELCSLAQLSSEWGVILADRHRCLSRHGTCSPGMSC